MNRKFICVLLFSIFIFPFELYSADTWVKLTPGGGPPAIRESHSAVWDNQNNRMLVFGGYKDSPATYFNDLWSYDGINWVQLFPGGDTPTGRSNHSAVWDGLNNVMLVFGGADGSINFNDLYIFNGTNWVKSSPAGDSPVARKEHSAMWDPANNRMLVFGGYSDTYLNDLWSFNGTNWTKLTPGGDTPTAKSRHSAVWDNQNNRMLILGGWLPLTDELHSFNGTNWTKIITPDTTSKKMSHSAVWDSENSRMVVFAGAGASANREVWFFNGVTWIRGADGFDTIWKHSAVWDPVNKCMLVFGGYDIGAGNKQLNDLWKFYSPPLVMSNAISIVSGNNQTGTAGKILTNPLIVKVTDEYNNPISGEQVSFVKTNGTDVIVGVNPVLTGINGIAQVQYSFDNTTGPRKARAGIGAGTTKQVTFDLTAIAEPTITVSESPKTELTEYPAGIMNESYVRFKWKATDDKDNESELKYLCAILNETFATSSTEYEKYPLEDGEYVFSVAGIDKDGNIDTTPAEVRFMVRTKSISIDSGVWKMLSLPRMVSNATPQALFGANANEMLVYRWNPQTSKEKKYQLATEMKTGEGYWVFIGDKITVNVSGEFVNRDNADGYRIHLYNGWNQMGNPYSYRTKWGECSVVKGNDKYSIGSGEANKSVNENIYLYDGKNGYRMMDSANGRLNIWQGYWVYANEECEIELTPNPARDNSSIIASSPKLSPETEKNGKEWRIQFKVKTGSACDDYNFAGTKENASEGYGPEDGLKPPAMENGVTMGFVKEGRKYAKDVRGVVNTIKMWEIEMNLEGTRGIDSRFHGNDKEKFMGSEGFLNPSEIEIIWEGITPLPLYEEGKHPVYSNRHPSTRGEYVYYIKDEQNGELVNMREKGEYKFKAGSMGGKYKFTFYAASPEYEWMITNKGVNIKDVKVYPNPMIATKHTGTVFIEFMTAEDANILDGEIKVIVYDISGEKVGEVSQNSTSDGIKYQFRWDCRNARGIQAGTGTYLCVITAKSNRTGQQRIDTGRVVIIR